MGGGGHSYESAKDFPAKAVLIGIDQDEAAIMAGSERLEPFSDRVTIVRSNYCRMRQVLEELGISGVDGIVLDLAYLPTSWIRPNADFHIERMLP